MRRRAPGVLVAAALLLAGCQTDRERGEGPLAFSPGARAGYAEFLRHENPGYFAMPPDGSTYGYSYCKDPRCRGHSPGVALWSCNQSRSDDDCRIYAYGETVLWRYPAAWSPPEGFGFDAAAATLPRVAVAGRLSPADGRLSATPGTLQGRLYAGPDLAYGALEVAALPGRGTCRGILRRTHAGGGLWEARCTDGAVLVGSFHLERGGRALRAFATDRDGNRLEVSGRVPAGP